MKITKDSHLDHELTVGQLEYIKRKFANATGFFKETFELPEELGTVPCSLVGPATGGGDIHEDPMNVKYVVRPGRRHASRMCGGECAKPLVRTVTVIAGPHEGEPCVLYTAYGGPCAPREPGDPTIETWEELIESRRFWAEHALIP